MRARDFAIRSSDFKINFPSALMPELRLPQQNTDRLFATVRPLQRELSLCDGELHAPMVPPSSASSSVRPLHTARHLPLPNVRALPQTFRCLGGILSEQYRSHRSLSVLQAFSQVTNRQAATAFARPSLCSAWHCRLVLGGATKAPHMSCHTSAPSFTALSHRPCGVRSGSSPSAVTDPGRRTNNSVNTTSAALSINCPRSPI